MYKPQTIVFLLGYHADVDAFPSLLEFTRWRVHSVFATALHLCKRILLKVSTLFSGQSKHPWGKTSDPTFTIRPSGLRCLGERASYYMLWHTTGWVALNGSYLCGTGAVIATSRDLTTPRNLSFLLGSQKGNGGITWDR